MILKRLKSDSGETISEVLVGVLIVGLATVLFATMIGVATNTSLRSVDRTMATYAQLSAVDGAAEAMGGAAVTFQDASDASTNVTFTGSPIKVNTISSTPDASQGTAYTFTRYLMPNFGKSSGGGA